MKWIKILVFDRSSHQIYYYDCKCWLINLLVLICCDFFVILLTILFKKGEAFIREGHLLRTMIFKFVLLRYSWPDKLLNIIMHSSFPSEITYQNPACLESAMFWLILVVTGELRRSIPGERVNLNIKFYHILNMCLCSLPTAPQWPHYHRMCKIYHWVDVSSKITIPSFVPQILIWCSMFFSQI